MDAAELSRWTRFAAKGGIGKCTATQDCVAESSEDLMFLKDDEITVLMQIPDRDGVYLGYCEGVVGKFIAQDVQFHTKLKRPVMTKRNSAASSRGVKSPMATSPTPTMSSNAHRNSSSSTPISSSPATPLTPAFAGGTYRDVPSPKRTSTFDTSSKDRSISRPSSSTPKAVPTSSTYSEIILPPTPLQNSVFEPAAARNSHHAHTHTPSLAPSEASVASSSTVDIDYGLPRVMSPPSMDDLASLGRQSSLASVMSSSSRRQDRPADSDTDGDEVVSTKRPESVKSSYSSVSGRTKSPASVSRSASQASSKRRSFMSVSSSSNYLGDITDDEEEAVRLSRASMASDGEVGIGMSLLANLGGGDSDDDESYEEHTTIHSHDLSRVEEDTTLSMDPRNLSPSPILDPVAEFPRPPSMPMAVATLDDPENPFGTFGRSTMHTGVRSGIDSLLDGLRHVSHGSMSSAASFAAPSIVSKESSSTDSEGTTHGPQASMSSQVVEHIPTASSPPGSVRSASVYSSSSRRSTSIQPTSPDVSPTFPPPNFRFPAPRPDTSSLASPPLDAFPPPRSPTFSLASGVSGGEWEGASDIYDNYFYRYSMASKSSRLSQMSMASRSGYNHRNIPSTSTMPPTAISGTNRRDSSPTMPNFRPSSVQTNSSAPHGLVVTADDGNAPDNVEEPLLSSLSTESTDTSATITPSRIPPRYDSLTMQRPPSVVASIRSLGSRRSVASSNPASPHHSDDSDDESLYSRLSEKPSLSLLEAHAASLLAPENLGSVHTTSALNVVKNSPSPNTTTTFSSSTSGSPGKNLNHRPSPLDLTSSNTRTDGLRGSTTSSLTAGPSPLLHTRWGSPVSSAGLSAGSMYDERSSGGYPTPSLQDLRGSDEERSRSRGSGVPGSAASPKEFLDSAAESEDNARNEPDTSLMSLSSSRPLVIEDDEELPSHAIDPSEGELDMSLTTIGSTNSRLPDDLRSSTHSSNSSINKGESAGLTPLVINDSLPGLQVTSPASTRSPASAISPTSAVSPYSPGDLPMDLLPPTNPNTPLPPPSITPGQPIPRPSLAELRGYPESVPEGSRRSLFLPHPNAPKAPVEGQGPMYIRSANNAGAPGFDPNQPRTGPDPKKVASYVIRIALNTPPPAQPPVLLPPPSTAPIRGNNKRGPPPAPPPSLPRGPTIYARVDVDLGSANGPVPVTFSPEPMGPPPLPLFRPPDNPIQPAIQQPPSSPRRPFPPQQDNQRSQSPQAGSVRRSVTASASLPSVSSPSATSTAFDLALGSPAQHTSGNVIPRADFMPQAGKSRPRSKSFSAANVTPPPTDIPTGQSAVVSPTLRSRGSSASLSSPLRNESTANAMSPTKTSPPNSSPLRPSSLSRPASNSKLRNAFSPSPLSLPPHNSTRTTSLVGGGIKPPLSPLTPTPMNGRPSQLRKVTSVASLPSTSTGLSSMAKTTGHSEGEEKQPMSPTRVAAPARKYSMQPTTGAVQSRKSNDLPGDSKDSDVMSIASSRSQAVSPTLVGRQSSLQSKLSLPNMRRSNPSRQGSISSGIAPESETMQVQDMDFELVRPNFPIAPSGRTSEDSTVLGRMSESRDPYLRAESPAISVSSGISGSSRITAGVSSDSAAFRSKATSKASDSEASMDAHRQREQKWVSMMSTVPAAQSRKNKKVRKLLGEGVPSSVRYLVWAHLTNAKSKGVAGVYTQLSKRVRVAAFADMERDVDRCFGEHQHLQSTQGPLLSLLQAYLTMVPDVQYSTGLTLIAGHTLLLAPEEDAFWIFVSMMDSVLRPYFSLNSTQMEVDAALFSRALEANDAKVSKKLLVDMGINPAHICFPWFTTLFVSSLPGDYVNRIWDLFLYEGVPVLIRVGLAIIYCCRRAILEATSEDAVMPYLKRPSPTWLPPSPEAFVTLAYSFKVKDDDIRKQRVKMEKQVKKQAQGQGTRLVANGNGISLPRES